jgi:hypothetical protein
MTPDRWEALVDFAAHDVGGNLAAAAIVALLAATWRRTKRRRQRRDGEAAQTAPD